MSIFAHFLVVEIVFEDRATSHCATVLSCGLLAEKSAERCSASYSFITTADAFFVSICPMFAELKTFHRSSFTSDQYFLTSDNE